MCIRKISRQLKLNDPEHQRIFEQRLNNLRAYSLLLKQMQQPPERQIYDALSSDQ